MPDIDWTVFFAGASGGAASVYLVRMLDWSGRLAKKVPSEWMLGIVLTILLIPWLAFWWERFDPKNINEPHEKNAKEDADSEFGKLKVHR